MSAMHPPRLTPAAAGLPRWAHRARKLFDSSIAADTRAVAAVEFALLLPVMLTLYIGSVEVSQALSVDRKVVLLSRTVGDLTTQSSRLASADLDAIAGAAARCSRRCRLDHGRCGSAASPSRLPAPATPRSPTRRRSAGATRRTGPR